MVEPLMRHPMAMMASKGAVEAVGADPDGFEADWAGVAGRSADPAEESMRDRRFVVEASIDGAALADWVLPPSMSLKEGVISARGVGTEALETRSAAHCLQANGSS
jgi:hypothetical protein